jgi:hypothetical protein
VTPNNLELVSYQENSLALVMLDSPNLNTSQLSAEASNDLSLLDDFPFSYDSGISIATTLVEGILSEFPITQDSLDYTCSTDATLELEGIKSIAYTPQTVLASDSDGAPRSDSNALSRSGEAIATTTTTPRSASFRKKLKELQERRFTHPQKMKPALGFASEGR